MESLLLPHPGEWVQYHLQFQALSKGLGMHPSGQGDTAVFDNPIQLHTFKTYILEYTNYNSIFKI